MWPLGDNKIALKGNEGREREKFVSSHLSVVREEKDKENSLESEADSVEIEMCDWVSVCVLLICISNIYMNMDKGGGRTDLRVF